jgi:formate dehydrogenase subunit gamma
MPSPYTDAAAREIAAPYAVNEGGLIEALHAVQAAFGCTPAEVVPVLAELFNLSRAEVHGVVSFYHDFRAAPAGRRVIKLCRAEACQAAGGRAVADYAQAALGLKFGETSADGALTLEAVYCLGLCPAAPAALIDGEPVGRLDGMALVAAARA